MSNAFASILQARPSPTFGRPVHRWGSPIDYSPVLLLMPFGFHLAMDTLPSGNRKRGLQVRLDLYPPGLRGITPAFGYGAPHPSARGTSTLLSKTRCSAHPMGLSDSLQG